MGNSGAENAGVSGAKEKDARTAAPKLSKLAAIGNSKNLGLYLLGPAFLFVVVFFLAPVILTGVFGFTNMSTATGITGGSYLANQASMLSLKDKYGMDELADQLSTVVYVIDEDGLESAEQGKADAALAASIFHFGEYTIAETKRILADRGIAVRL